MYLIALLLLTVSILAFFRLLNPRHPWRSTTPLSNEERYLKWVERHAEFQRRARIRKAQQHLRVMRLLDHRYARNPRLAQRATVHVPSGEACHQ